MEGGMYAKLMKRPGWGAGAAKVTAPPSSRLTSQPRRGGTRAWRSAARATHADEGEALLDLPLVQVALLALVHLALQHAAAAGGARAAREGSQGSGRSRWQVRTKVGSTLTVAWRGPGEDSGRGAQHGGQLWLASACGASAPAGPSYTSWRPHPPWQEKGRSRPASSAAGKQAGGAGVKEKWAVGRFQAAVAVVWRPARRPRADASQAGAAVCDKQEGWPSYRRPG